MRPASGFVLRAVRSRIPAHAGHTRSGTGTANFLLRRSYADGNRNDRAARYLLRRFLLSPPKLQEYLSAAYLPGPGTKRDQDRNARRLPAEHHSCGEMSCGLKLFGLVQRVRVTATSISSGRRPCGIPRAARTLPKVCAKTWRQAWKILPRCRREAG